MGTLVHELDLPVIDDMFLEASHLRETVLDLARDHWLVRTSIGYGIIRYEPAVAMLRDQRFHNLASKIAELQGVAEDPMDDRVSILSAEGQVHARLRRLVAPAFTPKNADRFRPYMREVVDELLDAVTPTGACELVADVCEPYPIPIICKLLGAPKEDWKLFSRWATDLLRIFNGNIVEDAPLMEAARVELDAYMADLIEQRRAAPADDLLTDLIAIEEAGDRLSADELMMLAQAVLVAGTDTTRNQLACATALMTRHPEQWALLAEHPELAPRAVEESMRVLGAVRGTGRFASQDVELDGVLFPEGTVVTCSFVATNNDDSVFADPTTFDITKERGGQPHLTFGSGIHYCLGAALARAELQEALPILARRLPDLTVDGEITWKPDSFGIWGPERLPLRFTPTPAN